MWIGFWAAVVRYRVWRSTLRKILPQVEHRFRRAGSLVWTELNSRSLEEYLARHGIGVYWSSSGPEAEYLTSRCARLAYGIPKPSLCRAARCGTLQARKAPTGRWLVQRDSLAKWMKARRARDPLIRENALQDLVAQLRNELKMLDGEVFVASEAVERLEDRLKENYYAIGRLRGRTPEELRIAAAFWRVLAEYEERMRVAGQDLPPGWTADLIRRIHLSGGGTGVGSEGRTDAVGDLSQAYFTAVLCPVEGKGPGDQD